MNAHSNVVCTATACCGLIAIIVGTSSVPVSAQPTVAYERSWDAPSLAGWLGADDHGNVYVPCHGDQVLKYDAHGNLLLRFGTPCIGWVDSCLVYPGSVKVSNAGEVYVADEVTFRVQVFSPGGVYLRTAYHSRWPLIDASAASDGMVFATSGAVSPLEAPRPDQYQVQVIAADAPSSSFRLDPCGRTLVRPDGAGELISISGDQFVRLSPAGACLGTIGTSGDGPGQFREPQDVAVLDDGTLVCDDLGNHRIQLLSPTGAYLVSFDTAGPFGKFVEPMSVAVSGLAIYVNDYVGGISRIHKFVVGSVTPVHQSSWGQVKAHYR